jgi:hypothetical protein
MVSVQDKKKMMDYLLGKLENNSDYSHVMPRDRLKNLDVKIDNILLQDISGKYGLILLVNQKISGKDFNGVYSQLIRTAQENDSNLGVVFYKDGEDFFKSGAKFCYYYDGGKFKLKTPLKHYGTDDIHKMILLRPSEMQLLDKGKISMNSSLQYYQPKSAHLDEGIVEFKFAPVKPDYSYFKDTVYRKESDTRFIPASQTEYANLKMWIDRIEYSGKSYDSLALGKRKLVGTNIQENR